jgi:hypothetical protein
MGGKKRYMCRLQMTYWTVFTKLCACPEYLLELMLLCDCSCLKVDSPYENQRLLWCCVWALFCRQFCCFCSSKFHKHHVNFRCSSISIFDFTGELAIKWFLMKQGEIVSFSLDYEVLCCDERFVGGRWLSFWVVLWVLITVSTHWKNWIKYFLCLLLRLSSMSVLMHWIFSRHGGQ